MGIKTSPSAGSGKVYEARCPAGVQGRLEVADSVVGELHRAEAVIDLTEVLN